MARAVDVNLQGRPGRAALVRDGREPTLKEVAHVQRDASVLKEAGFPPLKFRHGRRKGAEKLNDRLHGVQLLQPKPLFGRYAVDRPEGDKNKKIKREA